jgi:hypothetical protein
MENLPQEVIQNQTNQNSEYIKKFLKYSRILEDSKNTQDKVMRKRVSKGDK